MKTLMIASLVAGLGLTACASAVASDEPAGPAAHPPASRACFFSHQINGWRDNGSTRENVVYLDVGANDVYRLDTFGPCNDIDTALTIGVQTRGGDAICDGLDVTLIVSSPTGPYRCPVSKITKLTPDEIKALSGRKRH